MKYSFQKRRHKWNTWWAGRDAESDLVVDLMVCCLHVQFPCPILTLGRLLAPSWPHGEPAPGAIVVDIWEGEKKRHYFFFFFPYSESSFPEQAYQGIRCVPELDQEVLEDYIASSRGMDVSAPLIMEKDTCISLAIMWTSTWRYYQGHPGRGRRV